MQMVMDRVKAMKRASIVQMWHRAVLKLFEYLTFKRILA